MSDFPPPEMNNLVIQLISQITSLIMLLPRGFLFKFQWRSQDISTKTKVRERKERAGVCVCVGGGGGGCPLTMHGGRFF